jgi:predicted RNA-binding protein YlqC (UPF0109 family)
MEDKNFIEMVVKAIVNHPEDVFVDRVTDERGVLLTLKVHKEDMGRVIGKEGKNAISIRTLLRVVGSKTNSLVNLKISEPIN